ncbi:hypothetical protein FOZ60_005327 [Perkinsus olseni]|uniref:Uncharacterized protein n=1 Tax=Perkinsus olseni TaxID=32597 RepID=A0A7J6NRG1_PEROL|nr:hypothetical protein FOZ60_005327 [Perkinsus olseni]
MMNFISTWLIPAQLLVITTAQPYGNFVHRGTPSRHLRNYFGPYPLSNIRDNTYTFDLSRISVMSWYESIKLQLQEAGDAKADEPLAGIQTGDLTTLTYTSGDTLTTNFRNEFEYYETKAPHLRLSYRVHSAGAVGIQASCDGGSITPRFVFKLTRPDWGMPYNVRSVGLTPPYALIQMVQSDCPKAGVQSTDLLQVTFITKGYDLCDYRRTHTSSLSSSVVCLPQTPRVASSIPKLISPLSTPVYRSTHQPQSLDLFCQ